jgi:adenosylcobinamide-GDP ribazoletransferase
LRRLILAIIFLTRLPLPTPRNVDVEEIGRSTPFFPIVGLIIGLMLIGIDWLASHLWLPVGANAIVFVSLIIITGGLHFDGLMDTCDGIFSGRDRERMLEIMRDSRVGAFGVLGAICIALLKFSFLNALPVQIRWQTLLLFPVLGRWSMVWGITLFPYARMSSGLGRPFTDYAEKQYLLWASLPVLATAIILFLWNGFLLLIITGLSALLLGKWISLRIGGLTGDNYGAICEITETLSLITICALSS